ncbi:MAG TPA: SPFH domain-containing protein [Sumerlaeia bacterium]|nr:SPFH domain-containing protein [Sumerlaeia bacterium]
MRIANIIFSAIITLIFCVFLFLQVFLVRIDVGKVGVRTQQYGFLGNKGVVEKDFGAGWHRNLPIIDKWDEFDSTVQTMEFATAEERSKSQGWLQSWKYAPQQQPGGSERLELKSKDGYSVQFDITVKYRIKPGSAWELRQDSGTEKVYQSMVRKEADNTFRVIFGRMLTEEFYDPRVRRQKTGEAFELLVKNLEKRFVEVIQILIRDITFDPSYEQKILDKKLADQDVELNKSKAVAEEKRGLTNKINAETEAKVLVINEEKEAALLTKQAETDRQIAQIAADAKVQAAQIRADADLYGKTKIANGYLLEKESEAEGERLKAQALQGSGGANLVALEAVRGLQLGDMTISTVDTDFLDVEGMIGKLGAAK